MGRGSRGLSTIWSIGARTFGALDVFDASVGARSFAEALDWLATVRAPEPIREIQYWGHGRFGSIKLGAERLDANALEAGPLVSQLVRIRERLEGPEALLWLRTCEAFGTQSGHDFARALTRFFGCRVAGHTYVIAWAQSGLHELQPGQEPSWPVDEGIDPRRPQRGRWSSFWAPNTVPFLRTELPRWARDG